MKELISKIAKQTGESEDHIKHVVEAVAVELAGDADKLTKFLTDAKPLHRAHLASQAAKQKAEQDAANEAKSEQKPAKKAKKNS